MDIMNIGITVSRLSSENRQIQNIQGQPNYGLKEERIFRQAHFCQGSRVVQMLLRLVMRVMYLRDVTCAIGSGPHHVT